jgi:hypothetical protein
MMRRLAPALAWLILAACAVNVVVSSWLFYQAPPLGVAPSLSVFTTLWLLIPFLAFPLVGAFIVAQRPSNTVGWILLAAGLGTLVTSFSAAFIGLAKIRHTINDLPARWVDLAGNLVWPVNLTLGVLMLYLFPDGRPLSPRWRIVVWTLLATLGGVVLGQAVYPGPLEQNGQAMNPLGVPALAGFSNFAVTVLQALLPLFVLLAVTSLILRYRRAGPAQRQQIKWVVFGSVVMIIIVAAGIFANPLNPNSIAGQIVGNITFGLGILALPLGVGVGALRYRLYDIDVLINRALVYGSLTALLGALYFGLVAGAQALIRLATHQSGQNQLVIVLTTLLIAALVQPLRRGLQFQIDHRFYRRKYDAARTLEAFGATLRSEVELGDLKNHLLDVVSETMQPARVSLWLRPTIGPVDGREG